MGRKNAKFKSKSNHQRNHGTRHKFTEPSRSDHQQRPESDKGAEDSQGFTHSDIPGYYFDPEKKAYFKILPNHLGCGTSFVTKETISRKKNHIENPLHKKEDAKTSSTGKLASYSRPKRLKNENTCSIIHCAQTGQVCGKLFENTILLQKYRNLKQTSKWGASDTILPNFGVHLEALQRMELNSRRDKAVCVWSVEMDMSQKIQLMSISYDRKTKAVSEDRGCFPVKIQPSQSFGVTCSSKISSLSWSPLSTHPGKLCVLYTTIFPLGDFNSKVSISNLQARERDEVNIFDFSLGRGAVWSSAWNRVNNRFSVGCERKCQVVDVHARRQWVYSTGNSDALAQLFSVENPHLLYNGTRSGTILIHDLRRTGQAQVFNKLNQKMPVVCLRSPKDPNYLFASDFSGLICLWDLRMQKTVMKYSGLVNSHYQLPFFLDETEQFIYGTGSDGHCKLWNRVTGDIITTIPPPILGGHTDCLPMFPISHFSQRWTGHDGVIGAITGMGRKFFLMH